MKKFITILIILISCTTQGQEELDNYKSVAEQFMGFYNTENYNGIFEMFDGPMQQALPKDKTEAFLKGLNDQLGMMKEMTFLTIQNASHIYKTTFSNGIMDILIYLNPKNEIGGLYVSVHKPDDLPVLERNVTDMILPFNEEWTVFWGGTTVDNNYHVAYDNQKYAYDLVITKNESSFSKDRSKNENFYVFGKEVIAPCDAEVVIVTTGVHDNVPGEMNPKQLIGNSVVLKTDQDEFILFAHFKLGSVQVEVGQNVRQGDVLGLCGNSGNSSEPHLHLSLQNVADMSIATGAKLFFKNIVVNGEIKNEYLPIRNDKIQNTKQ